MIRIMRFLLAAAFLVAPARPTFCEESGAADAPKISGEYRFSAYPISAAQNRASPPSSNNDRGILLGGFSDLFRHETDPPGEFWIVTDRGPNGQVVVGNGEKRRTFPIPQYPPSILHVRINSGELQLLGAMPLVGHSGQPISGRPNLEQLDDGGYDFTGKKPVPFDPSGVDPEGMVRTADGTFWLAEEYRPSLLKVDAKGKVLKRFIPSGQSLPGAGYDVADVLPAIYARRQDNRGFEGLMIGSDGKTLLAAMQSSLANPTAERSGESRIARILAFDIVAEQPVAEYAYQFDRADEFNPGSKAGDMKIGALAASSPGQMLVLERDDAVAKIYRVNLAAATNLLKLPCHGATDGAALETAADLNSLGVMPLPKTLVADLSKLKQLSGKLEGLAVINRCTLAVVNDNDFGFAGFDDNGQAIPSGKHSSLYVIELPQER